jgi:hypothetical protein
MIRIPNDMGADWHGRGFAVVVTGLTALASGYLTVRGLQDPAALLPGGDTTAAQVLGAYNAVRTIALNGAALGAVAARAWGGLRVLMGVQAAVQLGDVAVGAWQGELVRAAGPACFAALLLIAAARLRRSTSTTRTMDLRECRTAASYHN